MHTEQEHWFIYTLLIVSTLAVIGLIFWGFRAAASAINSHFSSDAPGVAEERERAENALTIATFFSTIIAFALFVAAAGALAASGGELGALFVSVSCGLACLLAGAIVGFLFGVPRVIQGSSRRKATDTAEPASSEAATPAAGYRQQVNSNLEEISDWLTKIIVGVGLVEARKFVHFLDITATTLSKGFGSEGLGYALLWSILIFFPAAGFLGCYLLTRLFLAEAFGLADRAGDTGATTSSLGGAVLDKTQLDPTRKLEADKDAKEVATKITETIDVSELRTAEDFGRWAKAQILAGHISQAVAALGVAVEKFPENISLRLDYGTALFKANGDNPSAQQLDQLRSAYRRLNQTSELDDVRRLYKSLTYALLYLDCGFDDAIAYGEEYLARPLKAPSKGILLNLACAYGQKAASLRTLSESGDSSAQAQISALADKAYQCLSDLKKLAEERGVWSQWQSDALLRLDPDDPRKTQNPALKDESDLVTFLHDSKFRTLLGMSGEV